MLGLVVLCHLGMSILSYLRQIVVDNPSRFGYSTVVEAASC